MSDPMFLPILGNISPKFNSNKEIEWNFSSWTMPGMIYSIILMCTKVGIKENIDSQTPLHNLSNTLKSVANAITKSEF